MFVNRPRFYILKGRMPVAVDDPAACEEFFKNVLNRRVAFTKVSPKSHVSTVFLCLDHSFDVEGPPILFETLVFGGELADDMARYSTWDDAVAGHEKMVKRVLEAEGASFLDPWENRVQSILYDD